MAYPSVTYTFVNGATSDATEVNTNFTNLVNGVSDGTKDFNMNAGTLASTLTLGGALVLKEGITAPATAAGYVSVYVDTTTSQLRCIDGGGTVYEFALNPV